MAAVLGQRTHWSCAGGRAVQRGVVDHEDLAPCPKMQIKLHRTDAKGDHVAEPLK